MSRQELLANIPLFESLTPEDLDALSRRLEQVEYPDGEVIFRQGDEGSSLFIIEDGAVEIRFDTAWNAPHPVYRKLAEMFPDIAFEFTWSDEDEPDMMHTLRMHVGRPA